MVHRYNGMLPALSTTQLLLTVCLCVAVKHGSKMVDGHGEYRVYQNFWYVRTSNH